MAKVDFAAFVEEWRRARLIADCLVTHGLDAQILASVHSFLESNNLHAAVHKCIESRARQRVAQTLNVDRVANELEMQFVCPLTRNRFDSLSPAHFCDTVFKLVRELSTCCCYFVAFELTEH